MVLSVKAQNSLLNVEHTAKVFINKNNLIFNGGSMRLVGNGVVINHGNVMLVGGIADTFKTVTSAGIEKLPIDPESNFINKLNEPSAFIKRNIQDDINTTENESEQYTYGQLYISGFSQQNISGFVEQEFTNVNHGAYQQIGIPFWNKPFSTLSELGKSFNTNRWSQNEALVWNNNNTVFDNLTSANIGSSAHPAYSYYILGGGGNTSAWSLNGLNSTRILKGIPVSDIQDYQVILSSAGATVNYGTNGNSFNAYGEKYNTYLGDYFAYSRNNVWDGSDFGKNLYFFANPYLTNLDLSNLNNSNDPDYINNLYGIRFEPTAGATTYTVGQGGGVTNFKFVTKSGNVWAGDTEYLNVRPFGTFVIKLNNNTANPASTINFANLRRFNYLSRTGVNYSVTANKNGVNNTNSSVKQLAVVGLDSNGNELARTYFVVSPNSVTGHSIDAKTQVGNSNSYNLGTFEENPTTGGYDVNYQNKYWLYINEANDSFVGKAIKMMKYTSNISQFKFLIKENGEPIYTGSHLLSSGIGFYFKGSDGVLKPLNHEQILPATGNAEQEYELYYGQPNSGVLASSEAISSTRTFVVYNPPIDDYIIRFDSKWKKANIQVFDMSGKLVISEMNVDAGSDYTIKLQKSLKAVYVVKIVSDKGEIVQTKIER